MSEERELERHNNLLEQIKNANSLDELPNVSLTTISNYLAKNVYFDNIHISQTLFKPVLDEIVKENSVISESVKNIFFEVLRENYPYNTEEEFLEKYTQISTSPRIPNILIEVSEKNKKMQELQDKEDLENHQRTMKAIENAYEIKDLPKVGLSELNTKILRAFNNNDFVKAIRISSLRNITEAFLEEKTFGEIKELVYNFCNQQSLSEKNKRKMATQIFNSLCLDKSILYTVKEMKNKEERKLKIYKIEHEDTMQHIKDARRISQLPQNITTSSLAGYLSGNSTIFKKVGKISSVEFKNLTDLLLSGKKWEDPEIIDELKRLSAKFFATQPEVAFKILYEKFSNLPKTYYLVEEINESKKRQIEFIDNSCSNVNVYFVPNSKSPIDGGRFYNCYINRVGNLDLGQLLPLNLDEIVPAGMDIDSVEWFVQEYYDKTFKASGGIILNKDETIGNVNIFRPNDGNVLITKEEKARFDELRELSEKMKIIIGRKKEETERFMQMQEQFILSQQETDKELAELEAKIDLLTQEKDASNKKGGR